ncbi:DUF6153 family protein [Streptomyces desertarenae]|uniref:DUF6153 family protein n=1 Tax=Streptomyces desertarenae TaxID=2666184 RepID=A0ABW4PP64_9ACTN
MIRSTHAPSRPAGRGLVLLVMAVLTGVLGMHALAPGGALPPSAETRHAMATDRPADAHQAADAYRADEGCPPADGGSGHPDHADETCAAAGTGSAYTPPALTGAVADTSAAVPAVPAAVSAGSGRAPPDLSELQLLRI